MIARPSKRRSFRDGLGVDGFCAAADSQSRVGSFMLCRLFKLGSVGGTVPARLEAAGLALTTCPGLADRGTEN